MQPYQNFFMPQVQPYNFQQNPYVDRLSQLQQYQQSIQQPQVNQLSPLGKIVESIDIVKSTDIPMDGNMYYFPKADGSEIYGKQWMPNGTTRILPYKPVLEKDPDDITENTEKSKIETFAQVLGGIQSDIRSMAEKIDKINKPARTKKESMEDE